MNTTPDSSTSKLPQFALILITIIWGGSFLTVQYGLNFSSPILFVAFRFAAAAIAVSLISWKYLKKFNLKEVWAGFCIGTVIALGYGTQTIGLKTITSSESAFLTALYVPLVPILLFLLFRKKPHVMTWLGALLAFVGLVFLTGNGFGAIHLEFGQIITILGSITIALEIILISYFAGRVNVRRVTVLQLIFASLLCFIIAPFIGENQLPQFHWSLILVLIGLGIASAVIQLVMNWAQRVVDPAQAAIIYSGEPVWAALFGRIAGERLPLLAILGGCLVVLGVMTSEWRPKFLKKK
ncbi:DMT family transporter [Acinetobacter shaoyimingii]|uniref:DMT family transporter n=1 Tax=Acinetobacter shaoyimingii TaxID=2715164 RepID=A0A6G8RSJ8_9GAMM|nr:DMT family transporter [Acinetobacter shaoyimingii]NHB56803.1 DMT family transporter [Acinetobacter shaoyimingii]QIO04693.1 DMT family transporter [Acinetobacter shaoyimingii]